MNYTLMKVVRCLLIQSGAAKSFWAEALITACHIRNLCPSASIENEIPLERWLGRKVPEEEYQRLWVFGCHAWVAVKNMKLQPRAEECVLLGYEENVKGYRLWHLRKQMEVISRRHGLLCSKGPISFCSSFRANTSLVIVRPMLFDLVY